MTSPELEVTGNAVTGTGSDCNRKSRVLGWETADQVEKGSWAQGGAKPRRNAGSKSNLGIGGGPLTERKDAMLENKK